MIPPSPLQGSCILPFKAHAFLTFFIPYPTHHPTPMPHPAHLPNPQHSLLFPLACSHTDYRTQPYPWPAIYPEPYPWPALYPEPHHCLHASHNTTPHNPQSAPAPLQGSRVTIGRNDVDTIVTEYGVAQLRGRTVSQVRGGWARRGGRGRVGSGIRTGTRAVRGVEVELGTRNRVGV